MTRQQLAEAKTLAKSSDDLSGVDTESFNGFGLAGFKPIIATIRQVAAVLRWQALMLNGEWDSVALQECAMIFKKKVTII